jgi:hypothetical protein
MCQHVTIDILTTIPELYILSNVNDDFVLNKNNFVII